MPYAFRMGDSVGSWLRKAQDDSAIVFVHGVLSDGESAWRSDGAYWPDLVASEETLSSTGIYVFSYRTGVLSGNYSISDAVDALNAYLELDGLLADARAAPAHRPSLRRPRDRRAPCPAARVRRRRVQHPPGAPGWRRAEARTGSGRMC
jgi:hypothetical protein